VFAVRRSFGGSTKRATPSAAQSPPSRNLFPRLTQAVSRRQEFIADQIAAKLAGPAVMKSARAPAHSMYLNQEVLPVMQSGFFATVGDGIRPLYHRVHALWNG
jgi:hypothetical protein